MFLELQQRTTQTLSMTPQMEQAIVILEMGTLELEEYIQNLALENPVLDLDVCRNANSQDFTLINEQQKKKLEWLDTLSKSDRQNIIYYDHTDYNVFAKISAQDSCTIQEYLLEQASLTCSKELYPVVAHILGFLDGDGYLRSSVDEMLEHNVYSITEIEQAISYVQTLEPAGVAARSLSECLLLQLDPTDSIARRIVSKYLDYIAKGRITQLSKLLKVSEDDADRAVKRVRQLNPKPGSGYGNTNMVSYITPDILVDKENRVVPCEFSNPTLNLNIPYIDLMRKTNEKM